MKPKRIFLMSGTPGSGKSTWITNRIAEQGGVRISRDEIRFSMVSEEEEYFSKENEVFFTFISKIQEAILDETGPEDIYIDATHVNEKGRQKVLSQLDLDFVDEITVVVMDVPFEITAERNAGRSGRTFVPMSALRRMELSKDEVQPGGKYNYKIWKVNENGEITIVS